MNFVTLIQSQGTLQSNSYPNSFLVYFTVQIDYQFCVIQKQPNLNSIMADERVEVINKPEFLEASDSHRSYSHLSLLNNIVDVDKLDILMDKNDVTHSEANTSDLERYINQKFDKIIIANTEKKYVNLINYTSRKNTEFRGTRY